MEKIRVMLVDADRFWRDTLSTQLSRENDIELVRIANTKEEAVAEAESLKLDVILMDINLTKHLFDGLEAAREIALRVKHKMKIIMLTSFTQREVIIKSFQSGAVNCLTKSSYPDIVTAIRDAYCDKPSIHSDVAAIIREELKLMSLTPMERQVYELRQQGMNKTEIAEALVKSVNTIKTQLKSIKNKLIW